MGGFALRGLQERKACGALWGRLLQGSRCAAAWGVTAETAGAQADTAQQAAFFQLPCLSEYRHSLLCFPCFQRNLPMLSKGTWGNAFSFLVFPPSSEPLLAWASPKCGTHSCAAHAVHAAPQQMATLASGRWYPGKYLFGPSAHDEKLGKSSQQGRAGCMLLAPQHLSWRDSNSNSNS